MMQKLSEQDLRALIEGGESNTVELKIASPRPVEMAERLCGMANAQGGVVIVGVEDAERKIVGVPAERIALTKDVILRATRQIIKPLLVLDPPEPEIYEIDGKRLIVATIPSNTGVIYQSGGVFWIRYGTLTVPLSLSELLELASDRSLLSWEMKPAHRAKMEDIDLEKVATYLQQYEKQGYKKMSYQNIGQALVAMDCMTILNNDQAVPTNAGLLFFGKNPQLYIPHSEVTCVLFRDTIGTSKYIERRIITGTTPELINGVNTFLRANTRMSKDLHEQFCKILHEAVVNAVIHRDYTRGGENIRVFCYADRIEIHSPGCLLPGITIKQIGNSEVRSRLRNPVLANLLKGIPGYMAHIGCGIRQMFGGTKALGLATPQFRERGEVIVTFQLPAQEPTVLTDNSNSSHVTAVIFDNKKARLEMIMRHIQDHGSITNGVYRDIAGITDKRAYRDLELLVTRGCLKSIGEKRGRRYELP